MAPVLTRREAMACWYGTRSPYFAPLGGECAGTGTLHCICGGDFCICHWHGETDCPGCEDCDFDEDEVDQ